MAFRFSLESQIQLRMIQFYIITWEAKQSILTFLWYADGDFHCWFFYLPCSLWLTCHSEHSQSLESVIFKSCHYTSQVWQKIRKRTTGFNHDRFQVLEIFPEVTPKSWHFLQPLLLSEHVHIRTIQRSSPPDLFACQTQSLVHRKTKSRCTFANYAWSTISIMEESQS